MKNNPIGVLDSGVGGLSILKEVVKKLPNESFIYLADSKNCPYGKKPQSEIYRLSKRLVKFLLEKKVKLIIIACNTITVLAIEKLRKDFPSVPIVGAVPVVKTASEKTKIGRIGILSTTHTAKSNYQKKLIKKFSKGINVLNLGTDKLVSLIEEGERSEKISRILKEEIKPFLDFKIDVLALGCSHFPYLKRNIRKILGDKVLILDSGGAIARQVKRVLLMENLVSGYNKPEYEFYTTGDRKRFKGISKWKKIIL